MNKLEKLKEKQEPNAPILYYGDGIVWLKHNGYPAGIEIGFKSNDIRLVKRLPRKWIMANSTKKVLIYTLTDAPLPDPVELFAYTGYFKPVTCILATWNLNKIRARIIPSNIHYWELFKEQKWGTFDGKWKDFGNTYYNKKLKPKTI